MKFRYIDYVIRITNEYKTAQKTLKSLEAVEYKWSAKQLQSLVNQTELGKLNDKVARYRKNAQGEIIPSITGRAFICAETTLVQQIGDPFAEGISA